MDPADDRMPDLAHPARSSAKDEPMSQVKENRSVINGSTVIGTFSCSAMIPAVSSARA